VARCKWFRLPGGSAVTARADDPARVRLSVDANGTFDDTFAVGEHLVAAQCVHSTSLVDLHVARFVVDETRVAGRLPSGVTTWSGAVTITGDVTVPDDASLVIEPGTSVNIATTDDLRGSFFIDNPNAGSRNDDADNTLNRDFGRRDVIDIFVEGELVAVGTAAAPIRFVPSINRVFPGVWGGIRVRSTGRAELRHIEASGASRFLHGEYTPADGTLVPELRLTDGVIDNVGDVFHGVAPAEFDRVAISDVGSVLGLAAQATDVAYSDIDVERCSGPTFRVTDYDAGTGTSLSLSLTNVSVSRFSARAPFLDASAVNNDARLAIVTLDRVTANNVSNGIIFTPAPAGQDEIFIRESTFTGVDRLITVNAINLLTLERTTVDGFDNLMGNPEQFQRDQGDYNAVTVRDSVFRNGRLAVLAGQRNNNFNGLGENLPMGDTIVERNRFESVTTAIVTVPGMPFMRRNHFVGVAAAISEDTVFSSNGQPPPIDVSGSFWALADGTPMTEQQVRSAINDTAVSLGPDFQGNTRVLPLAPAPFLP
jgi:hypothetical protein